MSQVKIKKLQQGGVLTVDGEKYTLEEVNRALSMLSPEEQQYMAGLSRALAAGNNWTASSFDNTFTGTGVNDWMSGIFGSKEIADKKLGKTSRLSKTLDATFGNSRDTLRRASSRFFINLRHTPVLNVTPAEEKTEEELQELLRGSDWFDTDKEGKYIHGPSNARRMKIYEDAINHFLDTEENRKKKTHNTWGSDYDTLLNWISSNPNARRDFDSLKNKIISGENLNDTEIDILQLLGFDPARGNKVGDPNGLTEFKTKFGISDEDLNKYFGIDESGNIVPNQNFFALFNGDRSQNYWFNDAFRNIMRDQNGWNDALLPWLKNLWWFNGKLYKGDDANLLQELETIGFKHKNNIGNYQDSDKDVHWLWGQETPISYNHTVYSGFLHDLKGRYFDQRYYIPNTDGTIGLDNIVKYYDFNDPVDQYGLRKARYAHLDELGNAKEINENDYNLIQPYLNEDNKVQSLNLYERGTADYKNTNYYPTYIKRITNDITAYINPDGYVILDLPRGGTNAESITRNLGEDEAIKIPYSIWKLFGDNEKFWKKLMSDAGLREQFFNTMEVIVGNSFTGDFGQFLIGNRGNVLSKEEWKKLGLTEEQAGSIWTYIKSQNPSVKGSWWGFVSGDIGKTEEGEDRHEQNTVERLQSNKLGGWLPKMQQGGVFGSSNIERKQSEPMQFKKVDNSIRSKDLLNSDEHFTSSDVADLTSAVIDFASLGATFIPGVGNVAGAVGGAAADVLRFNANVQRDGFDLGDLSNLGVGLGLDALTLLPIVGTGAKAAKLVKNLTKVAKPLSKIFQIVGAGEAATAIWNVVANGKLTVEDVRKLTMGAQAVMGYKHIRRGANAEADLANAINKMLKSETVAAAKIKVGTKEVEELGEDVLKNIVGKKSVEAAKELKEVLKKERGLVDEDLKDITDSDLLKRFGLQEEKGKILRLFKNPLSAKRATLPKKEKLNEGEVTGRKVYWSRNPKYKWNNGKVSSVNEFVESQLENPTIREGLAKEGWFTNITPASNIVRPDKTRINYLAARLSQIAPGEDFTTSVNNEWFYKGRKPKAEYVVKTPVEITTKVVNPEPPAPTQKVKYNTPVVNVKEFPVPTLGKQQNPFKALEPDNFVEALQKVVYTPRFRQLVKTTPSAARQMFDKMRFNYVRYGTSGTPLTRGKEFDETAEALKAFNGLYFKKGGKVIKGQKGLSGLDLTIPSYTTPDYLKKIYPFLNMDTTNTNFELSSIDNAYNDRHNRNNNVATQSQTIGRSGNGISFNRADFEDALRLFTGLEGNRRVFNELEKGNRARLLQQINPVRLEVPRIYTGREKYIADQNAANIMNSSLPDISSDGKLRLVGRLTQNAQAESVREQGRLAETDAIIKQNQANTEIENKNKQAEVEAANKRNELIADVESKEHQIRAQKTETDFVKNILPYMQQHAQQVRNEMNTLDNLYKNTQKQKAITNANEYVLTEALRNTSAYELFKQSNTYKDGYTSNDDYLRWLRINQPDLWKTIRDEAYNKFRIYDLDYKITNDNKRYWFTDLINPKTAE